MFQKCNVNYECSWTTYLFIYSLKLIFLHSRGAAYNLKQPFNLSLKFLRSRTAAKLLFYAWFCSCPQLKKTSGMVLDNYNVTYECSWITYFFLSTAWNLLATPLFVIERNPKMLLDIYIINDEYSWTTDLFSRSSKFLRTCVAACNLKQSKNALGHLLLITFKISWPTETYA